MIEREIPHDAVWKGHDGPVDVHRPINHAALDASDFLQMVKPNQQRIDRDRLRELGETIYQNGGRDLLAMVDDVLAGRRLWV